MREIKFRGRFIDDKGWKYGPLLRQSYRGDVKWYIGYVQNGSIEGREVNPETVGQFTGLHDKDGREIYEGDIVECVSWNEYFTDPSTGEVMQPFRRKMYVEFRNGGFKMVEPMPELMRDNEWDIIYNGDIEVIGNIHDNPNY